MPDDHKKIKTMTLTTHDTQAGDECVSRKPSQITAPRKDADVIRVLNGNPEGSGKTITVQIRPSSSVNQLFDPVPHSTKTLNPGESVDWSIKGTISGTLGVSFDTDPDVCSGHDQDDFVIHC